MSDQQNIQMAIQFATVRAIQQAIQEQDRWSIVHQACYQAIRTCQQIDTDEPAEILWQIICPAIHQAFRTIEPYQWMRLDFIPDGDQNFDTLAASDAALEISPTGLSDPYIFNIRTSDTAFMTRC